MGWVNAGLGRASRLGAGLLEEPSVFGPPAGFATAGANMGARIKLNFTCGAGNSSTSVIERTVAQANAPA